MWLVVIKVVLLWEDQEVLVGFLVFIKHEANIHMWLGDVKIRKISSNRWEIWFYSVLLTLQHTVPDVWVQSTSKVHLQL